LVRERFKRDDDDDDDETTTTTHPSRPQCMSSSMPASGISGTGTVERSTARTAVRW